MRDGSVGPLLLVLSLALILLAPSIAHVLVIMTWYLWGV